jgi:hypothetical protein
VAAPARRHLVFAIFHFATVVTAVGFAVEGARNEAHTDLVITFNSTILHIGNFPARSPIKPYAGPGTSKQA